MSVLLLGMSAAATTGLPVSDVQRSPARVAIEPSDRKTASRWAAIDQLDALLPGYLAARRLQYVPRWNVKTVTDVGTGSPEAWTLPDLAVLGQLLRLTFVVELRESHTSAGSDVCARILRVEERAIVDSVCVKNTALTERAARQMAPLLGRALNRLAGASPRAARPHPASVGADGALRKRLRAAGS